MLREPPHEVAGCPEHTEITLGAKMSPERWEATLDLAGHSKELKFTTRGVQG